MRIRLNRRIQHGQDEMMTMLDQGSVGRGEASGPTRSGSTSNLFGGGQADHGGEGALDSASGKSLATMSPALGAGPPADGSSSLSHLIFTFLSQVTSANINANATASTSCD